jgi:serine/threonine protein kinase
VCVLSQNRLCVMVDACLGLACLHECTLLHCDIKPDNVLIRGNGRAAVADFGLSRTLQDAEQGGSFGYTPGYADPEWNKTKKRIYSTKSDIYALGMTILQTLTGLEAPATLPPVLTLTLTLTLLGRQIR